MNETAKWEGRACKGISIEDRRAAGKALREKYPRNALARWKPDPDRTEPLDILKAADATRRPELLPLRYGRMLASAFTYYRGSAGVMAADIGRGAHSGLQVQACGDCHLLNFGGFATPERRIIMDVNDLDETLPAPWEWDVQRLAASLVLAARSLGQSEQAARDAAEASVRSYRERMRAFSQTDVLDIWYARVDDSIAEQMLPPERRKAFRKRIEKATQTSSSELVLPKLVDGYETGEAMIRDTPPTIFHIGDTSTKDHLRRMQAPLAAYRETLAEDRRRLFDRFTLVDVAIKVVGIGSVGTSCFVGLFLSMTGKPLFLQMKEANASVLEPFAGRSAYKNHGERVVQGLKMVQPATDIFLGWSKGEEGRHFYFRQLRDVKLRPLLETFDVETLKNYGVLCGWALARAHAKSGDPWMISGYLGKSAEFDEAVARFAVTYADLAERDHAKLKAAVRAGQIAVQLEA